MKDSFIQLDENLYFKCVNDTTGYYVDESGRVLNNGRLNTALDIAVKMGIVYPENTANMSRWTLTELGKAYVALMQ